MLNRWLNQASGVCPDQARGARTWIACNVDEAAAVRKVHHVDRSGERARLVPTVLALDEAGVGQAHERTSARAAVSLLIPRWRAMRRTLVTASSRPWSAR